MKARLIAALLWVLFCAPVSSAQSPHAPAEGIVRRIEFRGLQRVSPATLRAHIGSREGLPLDAAQVAEDVRALERLGWFDNITVEADPLPVELASAAPALPENGPWLQLIFFVEERPFLARVEFHGSRLLRREEIPALLSAKGIRLRVAAPLDRTEVWRVRRILQDELAERGHPRAEVRVRLARVPTAAVRAIFEIHDGPRIDVARVEIAGNTAFSDARLHRQMKRVAPSSFLAGWRGKNIYTPARLSGDLENVERFYHDRGYPEARVGEPEIRVTEGSARRWLPFPRRVKRLTYEIALHIEEGKLYHVEGADLEGAPPRQRADLQPALQILAPESIYSERQIDQVRERISRLSVKSLPGKGAPRPQVDVTPQFDRGAGTVRLVFRIRNDEPLIVRRIEFSGHHRFSDSYYRRRVLLKEGDPFDAEKLDRGLSELARAGYIRPFRPEDVEIHADPVAHTVDVRLRVEEIGRQRLSLVGGASGLGSTAGLAYTVFDLLGGEELITTYFEGGPGTLSMLFGIAREGLLGSRASLGVNLFHNVIRPNLPGASGRGRLFTSRSTGLSVNSSMPVTTKDTLGFSYDFSRSSTEFPVPLVLPGVALSPVRVSESRRALGTSWTRDNGSRERFDVGTSVSGGWLGGDEKLVHSTVEYGRLDSDPLSGGRNAWAWRGFLAGVTTYGGGALPLQKRLFAGDQLLRGFRVGEVAPYTVSTAQNTDGSTASSTQPAGASLVAATNTEYRVPLAPVADGAEAVFFLDLGAGWLLPHWLGGSRVEVLQGTNGVLRASTGVELRFELPFLHQPLRVNYAVNPLRLARALLLPDGGQFRAPDRRSAVGWALGSFF